MKNGNPRNAFRHNHLYSASSVGTSISLKNQLHLRPLVR